MADQEVEEIITAGARNNMAGAFQTPEILQALEGRLGALNGAPSQYVEQLPSNVRRRILFLKNLSKENDVIQTEFEREVLELEKRYLEKHQILYNKRTATVVGEYEPTEEDAKRTEEEIEEDNLGDAPPANESIKGIPEFWLTVLKNVPPLSENITDADEAALKHLYDMKYSILPDLKGYKIEFYFSENEFFTDKILSKTYHLEYGNNRNSDRPDYTEGCTINWKADKDLTHKVEVKKQRHKSTNKVRTVKKKVPCDSFFNTFNVPELPEDDMSNAEWDHYEADFEIGDLLKEQVIPNAIDWFTGKALEQFEASDEEDEAEYDSEDDEDDDDEAEGQPAQECKQQ